jgi:predicted PurR-regulated permease PerM
MNNRVEISPRTIIFTVLFMLGLWLVWFIKDVIFLLFISFILMSALRPIVDKMAQWRIPRVLGILLVYAVVIGVFGVGIAGLIPSLIVQSNRLIVELPGVINSMVPYWNIDVASITRQIAPISENVLRVTLGIFSNFIATITVMVFTFYFLLERRYTESFLKDMVGAAAAGRIMEAIRAIEKRLGAWVGGQLFLMIVIGVLVYIGLSFLRVEFAIPLAILAGLLEIVPMIGPIVSAVPAILVAFASSPLLALSVVALYIIVQQLENNFIVPMVMRRSVGLSPIVTILALMIGGRLAGITGAVLAIPAVLVIQTVVSALLSQQQKTQKRAS